MADQAESGGVAGAGKSRKQKEGLFISYARRDGKHFAGKLRDRLESEAIPCWQDIVGMEGGRDWWMQIQDAINSVEFLVLVMTPAAMQSKTVRKEWRYARQQGVCVYPVIATPPTEFDALLNALPRWMRDVHFYNLGQDTEHFEDGSNWLRFLNDLRTRCEVPRVPFMADDLGVYIQRSKEYDALIDLLLDTDRDEPKAITSALALKGAGGYGKTTLARAICHDERIQEAFDDGILWVTLGESATYDTVREQLESLIFALSGERANAPTLEAAKTRLRELLADRDILLVIDDVWNADHIRPFLEGGERVARLITTRMGDTLPKGTRPVSVNQMTGVESFALITYGLPADQADAQRDELARMAARLGEYPLLLKLTNGILHDRMRDGEPLEKALDYLKRAFDKRGITKAIQVDNSTDRNRAVDASLSLSLERLNEQRREWFIRLAIFPDDTAIPFATLEKAWDCDELDAEDSCAALNRLSLLLSYNLQTRTVALHDVIRAYLREQLIGGTDKLAAANAVFLDRYGIAHWRDLTADEPYLWEWLAYHLIEAARGDDLIATVLDLRYLAAKTIHRGTAKVEADLEAAVKKHPHTAAVELLLRSYRNMAHILTRCETANDVLATLHTRLSHLDALKSACDAVEPELRPRIAPYHPLPDLPHPALFRTLARHTSFVYDAAWSPPDGRWIISASGSPYAARDYALRLWDATTGTPIRLFEGHLGPVNCVDWSPDGSRIVSSSTDGTIKIWDRTTGRLLNSYELHRETIRTIAWSPGGELIASASDDPKLNVWNPTTGEVVFTNNGNGITPFTSVAWSPDGHWLASNYYRRKGLKVWNTFTWSLAFSSNALELVSNINCIDFSPDSKWLVGTCADNTLILFSTSDENSRIVLTGYSDSVTCVKWSPDNHWIVSGSKDGSLKIWDTSTHAEYQTLQGHLGIINSVSWSPDGRWIISASHDGTLKMWQPPSYSGLPQRQKEPIGNQHTDTVNTVAYSPDGIRIVSASDDKTLKVWEAGSGALLLTLDVRARTAAYNPDGTRIVSASDDKTLKVWEAGSGTLLLTLDGHTDRVNSAAYSPDGTRIVSASDDNTLKVWEAGSGTLLLTLDGHMNGVNSAAYSPDGTRIVSASYDKTLKVWEAGSGAVLLILEGHTLVVDSADYSPDGRWIVSASSKSLRVWDAQTGVCRSTFYSDVVLHSCAWSPDSKYIVAGGSGGYLYWLRWVE